MSKGFGMKSGMRQTPRADSDIARLRRQASALEDAVLTTTNEDLRFTVYQELVDIESRIAACDRFGAEPRRDPASAPVSRQIAERSTVPVVFVIDSLRPMSWQFGHRSQPRAVSWPSAFGYRSGYASNRLENALFDRAIAESKASAPDPIPQLDVNASQKHKPLGDPAFPDRPVSLGKFTGGSGHYQEHFTCCGRARLQPGCVCYVSVTCEVHGSRCYGSHD